MANLACAFGKIIVRETFSVVVIAARSVETLSFAPHTNLPGQRKYSA
jgi:hypothetical protein